MLFEICLDDIAQELGCTDPACSVIVFDEAPISKIPLHDDRGRSKCHAPMDEQAGSHGHGSCNTCMGFLSES